MRQTGRVALSLSRRARLALGGCIALLLTLGVAATVLLSFWLPLVAVPVLLALVLLLGMTRSLGNDVRALRVEHAHLRHDLALATEAVERAAIRHEPGEPLDMLRRDIQRDLSSMAGLVASVDPSGPMPAPGGWAATPETLLTLVSEVLSSERVGTILECGSGTSTAWLARAVQRRGEGRVVSLEHDADFASTVRRRLQDLGVAAHADVRTAPLSQVVVGGTEWLWYSSDAWSDLNEVTLLFVDGPLGALARLARYPALPLLIDRLAPDAVIVLDDIHRGDEREILDRWLALPLRRELRVDRWTDRAVLLRFGAAETATE